MADQHSIGTKNQRLLTSFLDTAYGVRGSTCCKIAITLTTSKSLPVPSTNVTPRSPSRATTARAKHFRLIVYKHGSAGKLPTAYCLECVCDSSQRKCLDARANTVFCGKSNSFLQLLTRPGGGSQHAPTSHNHCHRINLYSACSDAQNNHPPIPCKPEKRFDYRLHIWRLRQNDIRSTIPFLQSLSSVIFLQIDEKLSTRQRRSLFLFRRRRNHSSS